MSATPASKILDRVLVLEMVRVTEAAAIASAKLIGRGDMLLATGSDLGFCKLGKGGNRGAARPVNGGQEPTLSGEPAGSPARRGTRSQACRSA